MVALWVVSFAVIRGFWKTRLCMASIREGAWPATNCCWPGVGLARPCHEGSPCSPAATALGHRRHLPTVMAARVGTRAKASESYGENAGRLVEEAARSVAYRFKVVLPDIVAGRPVEVRARAPLDRVAASVHGPEAIASEEHSGHHSVFFGDLKAQ